MAMSWLSTEAHSPSGVPASYGLTLAHNVRWCAGTPPTTTCNESNEVSCHQMDYLFDQPGIYAIHVAGELDESWSECLGGLTITRSVTVEDETQPVTVLIGLLADQAALAGVLDTLYQNRYWLLYVKYLGTPDQVRST